MQLLLLLALILKLRCSPSQGLCLLHGLLLWHLVINLSLLDKYVVNEWLKGLRESLLTAVLQLPVREVLVQCRDLDVKPLLLLLELRLKIETLLPDNVYDGVET